MAAGTGTSRTAISLLAVFHHAGWVQRVFFLADRRALVQQAVDAFKAHLPESSPVNLLDERTGWAGCTVAPTRPSWS